MKKRITDNDAFAGGIAAYAMIQSLLQHLGKTGTPQKVIRDIIEDAARSLELVSQQMRPKHPAMNGAILLLKGSAARRQKQGDTTQTPEDEALNLSNALSAVFVGIGDGAHESDKD